MLKNPLLFIMLFSSLWGAFFLFKGVYSIRKFRILRALVHGTATLVFLSVTAVSGLLIVANNGYRNLTKEECAAIAEIEPSGKQRFAVSIRLADGTSREFDMAGDMLYMDAHILKWNPMLNMLGIHTTYELDRIGGRYLSIEDEKTKPRTLYSLSKSGALNMYHICKYAAFLKPLVDAGYGSATFTDANKTSKLEILVSASGLMIRHKDAKRQ